LKLPEYRGIGRKNQQDNQEYNTSGEGHPSVAGLSGSCVHIGLGSKDFSLVEKNNLKWVYRAQR
jgi:hypothetical protein